MESIHCSSGDFPRDVGEKSGNYRYSFAGEIWDFFADHKKIICYNVLLRWRKTPSHGGGHRFILCRHHFLQEIKANERELPFPPAKE